MKACVEIAGLRLSVSCDDPAMRLGFNREVQKFIATPEGRPDLSLRVVWNIPEIPAGSRKVFDSGALWKLYAYCDGYQFRFSSSLFGSEPYKVAMVSSDFRSGVIHLQRDCARDETVYPLEYPLDELLIVNLLSQGHGVEVHASGVVDAQGCGYLFFGHSGAGKTTISGLWDKSGIGRILSDDRIILRKEFDSFWMYGTPWHGEGAFASPERVRLSRIYFLKHAESNSLSSLNRALAAARTFACSFPPFFSKDGISFTMRFIEELVGSVPCCELGFVPNETVVRFLMNSRSPNVAVASGRG